MSANENLFSSGQLLMATSNFKESLCSLEWKIKNFSLFIGLKNKSIQSPPLNFSSSKWALCLRNDANSYLGFNLVKISSVYVFRVESKIYFKDKNNEIRHERSRVFEPEIDEDANRDVYFVRQLGNKTVSDVLCDDVLTVHWELCVLEHSFSKDVESTCRQSTGKKDGKAVSVVSEGQANLLKDVEALLNEQRYCDVTLQVGDEKFPSHKLLLAARSSVFASMFEHDMVESRSNTVTITDIDGSVMKDLLRYIYSGKVDDDDLSTEKSIDLYAAADKYALLELKSHCTRLLQRKISIDTACDILVLADEHNDGTLIDSIKIFARDNTQFLATDKWRRLVQERSGLASEIILALSAAVSSNQ